MKLYEVAGNLTPKERRALSSVIDGTIDSIEGGPEEAREYQFWINILYKLGDDRNAREWEKALRQEGILR